MISKQDLKGYLSVAINKYFEVTREEGQDKGNKESYYVGQIVILSTLFGYSWEEHKSEGNFDDFVFMLIVRLSLEHQGVHMKPVERTNPKDDLQRLVEEVLVQLNK
ncbi:hypothetical protein H0266_18455 [Halobacillus locisalis]|uniref:Uncharacterized protein n=1 Tax=Halobacillus locisalis TaxID=220753 RepID=A0A838CYT7_9BACI|nr:hypothetical protein [Halobacillus locisalis]MBA2176865.1 hypothetical protein [Halobacillus locisalis]